MRGPVLRRRQAKTNRGAHLVTAGISSCLTDRQRTRCGHICDSIANRQRGHCIGVPDLTITLPELYRIAGGAM